MTSGGRRLRRRFQERQDEREPRRETFRGVLGNGEGEVRIPGEQNKCYVRIQGRSRIDKVINVQVPAWEGLPVVCSYSHENPTVMQVLEVDFTSLADVNNMLLVEPHHETHELLNPTGGHDVVWIHKSQFTPGLGCPTSPASMQLQVFRLLYRWVSGVNCFVGDWTVDLSAYIPTASNSVYLLVSIDGATNALQYTLGPEFPSWPATAECTTLPVMPAGCVPIQYVLLWAENNLLDNDLGFNLSEFEDPGGGGADIWAYWTEFVGAGALANDAVIFHGGANSCQTNEGGGGRDTGVYQDFLVEPGERYQLRFWTRGDGGANDGAYRVYDVTNGADIIATTGTGQLAAAWAEVTVIFNVPATCTTARVYFYCPAAGASQAWFDTVTTARVISEIDWPNLMDARFIVGESSGSVMPAIGDWLGLNALSQLSWQPDTCARLRAGVLTEYADPDDAFTNSDTAGDVVLIPPGTWTLTAGHFMAAGVSVIGLGNQRDCILQSLAGTPAFTLLSINDAYGSNFRVEYVGSAGGQLSALDADGSILIHVEGYCKNTGNGGAEGIGLLDESTAYDCYGYAESWGGDSFGLYMYSSTLYYCRGHGKNLTGGVSHGIMFKDDDCFAYWSRGWSEGTTGTNYGLSVEGTDNYAYHCVCEGDDADIELAAAAVLSIYDCQHDTELLGGGATLTQLFGDRAGTALDETITGQYTFDRVVGPATIHRITDANNAGVTELIRFIHELSAGAAAAGMGIRILFQQEDDATNVDDLAAIEAFWGDPSTGSEDSSIALLLREGGAALARFVELTPNSLLSVNSQELDIGDATAANQWGNVFLADHHDIYPDGEDTHAYAGLMRRFVNKVGIDQYINHRGTGLVIPPGCTQMTTPANLWATWLAGYWGWLYGTYYGHYPNHATLPAGVSVIVANPLPVTVITARVHVTGGCNFGVWADNYNVLRNYNVGDYIYRYDVYAYGLVNETLLYTQTATSVCTVGGVGAAATFAAWVNHAVSGPYGPFCPTGDGVVLRLRANHAVGTGQCYPYVMGEQGAATGVGGAQVLYDDAWPGTNPYDARRMGTFQRTQGYGWSVWDWYDLWP